MGFVLPVQDRLQVELPVWCCAPAGGGRAAGVGGGGVVVGGGGVVGRRRLPGAVVSRSCPVLCPLCLALPEDLKSKITHCPNN